MVALLRGSMAMAIITHWPPSLSVTLYLSNVTKVQWQHIFTANICLDFLNFSLMILILIILAGICQCDWCSLLTVNVLCIHLSLVTRLRSTRASQFNWGQITLVGDSGPTPRPRADRGWSRDLETGLWLVQSPGLTVCSCAVLTNSWAAGYSNRWDWPRTRYMGEYFANWQKDRIFLAQNIIHLIFLSSAYIFSLYVYFSIHIYS